MESKYSYPRNHGNPWHHDDVRRLRHAMNFRVNIPKLAESFGRTEFAIRCMIDKIRTLGKNYVEQPTESRNKKLTGDLIINGTNYTEKLELVRRLIDVKIKLLS